MSQALFVLYVADQDRARDFYAAVLGRAPKLDVPGMCEFELQGGGSLGLMPGAGAAQLLGPGFEGLAGDTPGSLPRAELYLRLPDAAAVLARALDAGARLISPLEERDWNESAAYVADPDGHVLALAQNPADPMLEGSAGLAEATLEVTEHGTSPKGPGWFIANLATAAWMQNERFGSFCRFEGDTSFEDFGLNVQVLQPGQPACLYHREDCQEGFLVLRGRCQVVIEGQLRELRTWDYLHCPAGATHVLVGGGEEPSAVLMVGKRDPLQRLFYPVDPEADRHGASAQKATKNPPEAYVGTPSSQPAPSEWE